MSTDDVLNYLKTNGNLTQVDAFMSSSADNKGVSIEGSGLQLHIDVPPSVGAGAYVAGVSQYSGENEFLFNNNSVIKWDSKSVYADINGTVHISGKWIGQAKDQSGKSARAKS